MFLELLPPMPGPQAGSLTWAQTSLLWENLSRCGTWLHCESGPPPVLWFFLVFGCRASFLVGSSLFCWWLFSSCDFGFCERRWAQVLLLHRPVSLCHLLAWVSENHFIINENNLWREKTMGFIYKIIVGLRSGNTIGLKAIQRPWDGSESPVSQGPGLDLTASWAAG